MTARTTLLADAHLLIEEGIYENQESLLQDALRALLRSKPELRHRLAVALYHHKEVSLARASEIAGVDQESFKELLREADIPYHVEPLEKTSVNNEVERLLHLRNIKSAS